MRIMLENFRQIIISDRIQRDKLFIDALTKSSWIDTAKLIQIKNEEQSILNEARELNLTKHKDGWFINGNVEGSRVIIYYKNTGDHFASIGSTRLSTTAAIALAARYYLPVNYLESETLKLAEAHYVHKAA